MTEVNYTTWTNLNRLASEARMWKMANAYNRREHRQSLIDNDLKQAQTCLDSALRGEKILKSIKSTINLITKKA
jgi:hypothetical protein